MGAFLNSRERLEARAVDDATSSILSVRDGTVAPRMSAAYDGAEDAPAESALPAATETEEVPDARETPTTRESSVLSVHDGTMAQPLAVDLDQADAPAESALPVATEEAPVAPEAPEADIAAAAAIDSVLSVYDGTVISRGALDVEKSDNPAESALPVAADAETPAALSVPIIDTFGVVAPVYARAGITRKAADDGARQLYDLAREISSANEASLPQTSKVQIRQASSTLALSPDDAGGRPLAAAACTSAAKLALFQRAFGSTEEKIPRPEWLQNALNAVKVTEKQRWADGELANAAGEAAQPHDGFSPLDQAGAVACDLIRQKLGCFQLEGETAPVPDCRSVESAASFALAIFADAATGRGTA